MYRLLLPLVAFSLLLPARGQPTAPSDSTGLPGDHFSLQGALELFKRNIEMERFEQELNTDSNHVNNLDLDGNGATDFVRVETRRDGDAVIVVMKVAISATESQDVAVIGIEQNGEEAATLQIIGDEGLYPPDTFVEPFVEGSVGGNGPTALEQITLTGSLNIWSWRPIPFCFSPRFYAYTSPYGPGNRAPWWSTWPPYAGPEWRSLASVREAGYRSWPDCRVARARAIHTPIRTHSAVVEARFKEAFQRYAAAHPGRATDSVPANSGKAKTGTPGKPSPPTGQGGTKP